MGRFFVAAKKYRKLESMYGSLEKFLEDMELQRIRTENENKQLRADLTAIKTLSDEFSRRWRTV